MVQPNAAATGFTYWMLNISKQHLSGPQRIIVQNVYNSSISNIPISDQEWYNFNLFSAWRNPYYQVFRDYAMQTSPGLLNDIIASFNFEGNSIDSTGNFTPTDNNMSYGLAFGKVLQGASFNGINSTLSNDVPYVQPLSSFNFWINPHVGATGAGSIFGVGSPNWRFDWGAAGNDLTMQLPGYSFTMNGIFRNTWTMVTVVSNSATTSLYVNGNLQFIKTAPMPYMQWNFIGQVGFGNFLDADLDMLSFWTKALTFSEITSLYNGGAGLQYPF
jgi:hypothetical protein